ncbi:MAG: PAS domain S-box protein, partial [Melioribacteraceae bacterium]|nr:PAS domain S-box protein [Melioribacteraceae bacterium]
NGIVITDALKKDNPIIYVNRAYQKITGYSRLESIGRNCRFLQGEDVNQTEVKRLKESIKNQAPCSVLLRNYKKDGTLFWNELSISPIHDYNGVTTHFIGIQTDVTERKNTEIKLEESNNRFGALIENLQAGLMVEDENRKISLVNQEFCDMFGIPAKPQQMIGYDCALASEEAKKAFVDEDMFINKITKILKEKKPVRFEEYELKDGRVFERDYIPIFVSENYKGHLWQYRDVTEKKNSEKELKKLKHFYEKVLNDLPGQIAVFDKDFRYLYLNPASVKNDEIRLWLVGKNDFEYCEYRGFETKIAEDRTKRLTMVSERKEPIRFEEIINKPDGGENYFIRVISPILDDNGTVQQLLAYGLDITDLKLAEREVQTARKQLENVLDATAEGIVTIDERSKIVMVNNEVENIWGYSKAELIGQPVTILMHTKFHDMHMNGMNRYLETRVPRVLNQKLELEGMRKNGEEFPINITIKETKLDDRLLFTAAIHDTTELKSLLKKLENSNKSLSEFAYIASHDLREPLRKITAFGELLNESLEGNIEEDDAENLKLMVDGANRMQKMINDLLSYSKITSTVEEHSKIDLKKLVDELADFELAALIEESNAKIEFGKNLGPVRGENTQIKQLFQNIISNGIKYRKPDIDPIIEITMDSGPRFYTVKIKDNGIGIKEEYYNQIFEMFKRLHSREEYSGTGIGLSVCKRIVEISGGKIGVESTVGEGSTFWFELPKVN